MMINHLNPIIDVRFFRKDCVSFIISWRHGIYICWLYISRVSRKSNIFLPVQHVQAVEAGSNMTSIPHSYFVHSERSEPVRNYNDPASTA